MSDEMLFDLVKKAQVGDKQALDKIITNMQPLIKKIQLQARRVEQDDIQQSIIEIIIKKIMAYDLDQTPNFTTFCDDLLKSDINC
ncbi:helix-turn-helix domain-containing protein [Paenibacillus chibensis]|uniref:helix-turn-helix domain-containing protein n=1 Tax=Paenibacillus chibensis TaxID=59846 RepID=UPI000FDAA97C|nr:helix-turn-helix domain-containing protein [Paenibacillus chibensis]MEC0373706.1 helix-turn-helix domain-containing protein [Paenibacillus chibensis]